MLCSKGSLFIVIIQLIYRSAQEKSSFFAFTPRTKKFSNANFCGENSARFRVSSRNPIFRFKNFRGVSPRNFAQILRENSESFKKK